MPTFVVHYGGKPETLSDQDALFLLMDTYGANGQRVFLRLRVEGGGKVYIREGILEYKAE